MEIQRKKEQFSERLNEAAKAAGKFYYGMYSDVAREFGMTPRGVQKWFIGEAIPYQKIEALAKYYRVRPEWLQTGAGAMREVQGIDAEGKSISVEFHAVPLLKARQYAAWMAGEMSKKDVPTVITVGELSDKAFAFQVEDTSLHDKVLKGMCVVVEPEKQPGPDDLALVVLNDSFVAGHLVKRGVYTITPPNSDYRPIELGSAPEIAGTLVSIAQTPISRG